MSRNNVNVPKQQQKHDAASDTAVFPDGPRFAASRDAGSFSPIESSSCSTAAYRSGHAGSLRVLDVNVATPIGSLAEIPDVDFDCTTPLGRCDDRAVSEASTALPSPRSVESQVVRAAAGRVRQHSPYATRVHRQPVPPPPEWRVVTVLDTAYVRTRGPLRPVVALPQRCMHNAVYELQSAAGHSADVDILGTLYRRTVPPLPLVPVQRVQPQQQQSRAPPAESREMVLLQLNCVLLAVPVTAASTEAAEASNPRHEGWLFAARRACCGAAPATPRSAVMVQCKRGQFRGHIVSFFSTCHAHAPFEWIHGDTIRLYRASRDGVELHRRAAAAEMKALAAVRASRVAIRCAVADGLGVARHESIADVEVLAVAMPEHPGSLTAFVARPPVLARTRRSSWRTGSVMKQALDDHIGGYWIVVVLEPGVPSPIVAP